MTMHETLTTEQQLTVYQENAETFRSLNQLMWQIPLIAMTLTGGLWFGVSRADATPVLQLSLLGLAAVGNSVLIVVLGRLRYIMGCYLAWLETFYPPGFVSAPGENRWDRPATVRTMFQIMLGLATGVSLILMVTTAAQAQWFTREPSQAPAVAYYDQNAASLADTYEGLSFQETHPELAALLTVSTTLRILDVGAGSGRDAAAMASFGHQVTAVEPSGQMRALAQRLHPTTSVAWTDDALPALSTLKTETFDIILLSAVWMHVEPSERRAAFARLADLLAPGGRLYITLRLGPAAAERAIFTVSEPELEALAKAKGMRVTVLGDRTDLLGRREVSWRSVVISPKTSKTP